MPKAVVLGKKEYEHDALSLLQFNVADELVMINHIINEPKCRAEGAFRAQRRQQTVQNGPKISFWGDLRPGGFMTPEMARYSILHPMENTVDTFPNLGPLLREVSGPNDITFTHTQTVNGEAFSTEVRIIGRKQLLPDSRWEVQRIEAGKRARLGAVQRILVPQTSVQQVTPQGYDMAYLSDLRAFRLARFLTLSSPRFNGTFHHPMVLVPITERGLKIRVASSHPSYLAHYSRCLSKYLLPFLKDLSWSRSSLKAEEIKLHNRDRNARLFSADLSAASDHIDHGVGQAILKGLLEGMGVNSAEVDGAMRCLEPYTLEGRLTTRGAHMGLGTTWSVLSLLNAFAGYQACSDKRTFRICGDDLIGLWTEAEQHTYVRWIEKLGLQMNLKKSFRGVRGVFCEKLIQINRVDTQGISALETPDRVTTLKETYSESVWTHNDTNPENKERVQQIASDATQPYPIRRLAEERLSSFKTKKGITTGPSQMGGSGIGKIPNRDVLARIKAYLIKGPFSIPTQAVVTAGFQERMSNYRISRQTDRTKAVPYRDVLTAETRAEYELAINETWKDLRSVGRFFKKMNQPLFSEEKKKDTQKKDTDHRFAHVNALRRWLRGTRQTSMTDAITHSKWVNSRTRSRLRRLVAGGEHNDKTTARWRSKITYLLTRTPVQQVPLGVLAQHPVRSHGWEQSGQALLPKWEKTGPNA